VGKDTALTYSIRFGRPVDVPLVLATRYVFVAAFPTGSWVMQ